MDLGWIWGGSGVDLEAGSDPVRDPVLARFSELIAEGRRSRHGSAARAP